MNYEKMFKRQCWLLAATGFAILALCWGSLWLLRGGATCLEFSISAAASCAMIYGIIGLVKLALKPWPKQPEDYE